MNERGGSLAPTPSPHIRWRWVIATGVAYVLIGVLTAALSGAAGSRGAATGWRLAAWVASLAVFVVHLLASRPVENRTPRIAALEVALGVALGALLLGAAGPVRSHWNEPSVARIALLSLGVWPLMTGAPAFVVAYATQSIVSRLERRSARSEGS